MLKKIVIGILIILGMALGTFSYLLFCRQVTKDPAVFEDSNGEVTKIILSDDYETTLRPGDSDFERVRDKILKGGYFHEWA